MSTGLKNNELGRKNVILGFFAILMVFLLLMLANLQLFDDTYKKRARSTTIDRQTQYPSRGLIYDRNGKLVVFNHAIYDIDAIYDKVDPQMDTALFCSLLNIDEETFVEKFRKDWSDIRYAKNVPFPFLRKVPAKTYTKFAEFLDDFPGFIPKLRNIRGYNTEAGAHLLGYTSEVNEKVLEDSSEIYDRGDYLGITGLEKQYEPLLRGAKGTNYVLKDTWGHVVGEFDNGSLDSSAISGKTLVSTIDIELQEYAEGLFKNKIGAAVAIEPSSGEVLSLVTSPNYSPTFLSEGKERGMIFDSLIRDSLQPFFNRAISARYPPGSTIKPLIALIALQENVVQAEDYITCNGGYSYNKSFWGCHAGGGRNNLVSAIQRSCNTYFYMLYRELVDKYGFTQPKKGLSELSDYFHELKLGVLTGIDMPNESKGLIPTPEYYDNLYSYQDAEWRSTYIISNGIGQGEMQMTTLQLAHIMAFFANRGSFRIPHLISSIDNSESAIREKYQETHNPEFNDNFFRPIIEGMEYAVEYGTADGARIPGIRVAGKTGTSQNPHGKDHSVFVGFAPVEDPQIAIAVYVENAGWGSAYAAPLAGLIMEKYLRKTISPNKEYLEERMLKADLIHQP